MYEMRLGLRYDMIEVSVELKSNRKINPTLPKRTCPHNIPDTDLYNTAISSNERYYGLFLLLYALCVKR